VIFAIEKLDEMLGFVPEPYPLLSYLAFPVDCHQAFQGFKYLAGSWLKVVSGGAERLAGKSANAANPIIASY